MSPLPTCELYHVYGVIQSVFIIAWKRENEILKMTFTGHYDSQDCCVILTLYVSGVFLMC
ncbi:hypothetical protein GCM10007938_23700 [Vibrio zhanjiangensis]|uniref:Uncharacterized protein n=1 Tax=Vibrio zhanjiangensis TaxID=1046128 RepID=A0ABQ6F000_9VIBR|nr:hypothetical protein GCM10007938_23700 [Vibrio zhanjiangensis]